MDGAALTTARLFLTKLLTWRRRWGSPLKVLTWRRGWSSPDQCETVPLKVLTWRRIWSRSDNSETVPFKVLTWRRRRSSPWPLRDWSFKMFYPDHDHLELFKGTVTLTWRRPWIRPRPRRSQCRPQCRPWGWRPRRPSPYPPPAPHPDHADI